MTEYQTLGIEHDFSPENRSALTRGGRQLLLLRRGQSHDLQRIDLIVLQVLAPQLRKLCWLDPPMGQAKDALWGELVC